MGTKERSVAARKRRGKKKDPRLARAKVAGFNKPRRTPSHPKKSHIDTLFNSNNLSSFQNAYNISNTFASINTVAFENVQEDNINNSQLIFTNVEDIDYLSLGNSLTLTTYDGEEMDGKIAKIDLKGLPQNKSVSAHLIDFFHLIEAMLFTTIFFNTSNSSLETKLSLLINLSFLNFKSVDISFLTS